MNKEQLIDRHAQTLKSWVGTSLCKDECTGLIKNAVDEALFLYGVSKRFSTPEKMAEWLHNNYEEIALNNGWKTQDDCQVPFLDLPNENKQTMIEVCERFLNVC